MAAGFSRYDVEAVRRAASGRWADILSGIGGIPRDRLTGAHGPCPKCGGKDRFRAHSDFSATGGLLCGQCFSTRNGDGFAALQWLCGIPFSDSLRRVAEFVGVAPESKNGRSRSIDPAKDLEPRPWNTALVSLWCQHKKGITPAAVQLAGGMIARYRGQHSVIALPVWGPKLKNAKPVGWCLFAIGGGKLPRKPPDGKIEWVKVKLTYGSQPGVIGVVRDGQDAWKTEGPTDMLAVLSLADCPGDATVVCNAFGSKEDPAKNPWIAELFKDRRSYVVHDCDVPGQEGATEVPRTNAASRPGWSLAIAAHAAECRNVVLPYPIEKDHGKDLRDWTTEPHTYKDLVTLADESPVIQAPPDDIPKPIEADNDPHRLARINLERFSRLTGGGAIRCWCSEWFKWEVTRGCYRVIAEKELRARVNAAIKEEFNRISINRQLEKEEDSTAIRVTPGLVNATIEAIASTCTLSGTVPINSWVDDDGKRSDTKYLAMKNGLLDLEGLLNGSEDFLLPFSPSWFSTVCLPYEYDSNAQCPKWLAFLNKSLEGDSERIAILQEWAGYMLTASTDQQKFLFLEGEGSNGKSVFIAGMEGMLGKDNCSHVNLEVFGQPFSLHETIGKLANIASECNEMDTVSEGYLKAMTDGSRMSFNRKGMRPIETAATARLMFSANVRPRFNDKSNALWRRMILVPWRVQIQDSEKILGMDKMEWWEKSGELPGILRWAIAGLARLRANGRFSKSSVCEAAISDYRDEVNPARTFLKERYVLSITNSDMVSTRKLYDEYAQWCMDSGYRPLSDKSFGREVSRVYSGQVTRHRNDFADPDGRRGYSYLKLMTAEEADRRLFNTREPINAQSAEF